VRAPRGSRAVPCRADAASDLRAVRACRSDVEHLARRLAFGRARAHLTRYAERVNLDAGTLVAGFLVSGVGFVFFSYGRKMGRPPHVITGLVLMIFPYFIPGVLLMFGIGALICALLYLATRAGY